MITTILFDLDGTLLPMGDMDLFINEYFKHLAQKMAKHGYEPNEFVKTIWNGTKMMFKNTGEVTNEEVFWRYFESKYENRKEAEKLFYEFYENEFDNAKTACGYNELVPNLIKELKQKFKLILATNPLFPPVATIKRASWAGVDIKDFAYYTTYDNSKYSKPNLKYYEEVLEKNNIKPNECLMVGNDIDEDMVAKELGMQTFLVTDCIINRHNKDINEYYHGDFNDLLEYIKNMK